MVLALLVVAACRASAPAVNGGGTSETGAATPQGAVEAFLTGVRDGDLQVMSNLWGDSRGPARTYLSRDQHDQRLILMQCYLNHDQRRLVSGPTQKADTSFVELELRKGQQQARTTFKMLQGPAARWYVNMVEPLRSDFCRR